MSRIFQNAEAFNADISSWDVSSVTGFYTMFGYTYSFNQDLSSWDVDAAVNFIGMFSNATAFNQCLDWNIDWKKSGMDTTFMFEGSKGKFKFSQTIPPATLPPIQSSSSPAISMPSMIAIAASILFLV